MTQYLHIIWHRRSAIILVLALLNSTPSLSDVLNTNWDMTSDKVLSDNPTVSTISEPITSVLKRIYKLRGELKLDEYEFNVLYGFRESDDRLDAVFLTLTSGSPSGLYESYDNRYGPGEVITELGIVQNKMVHEVRFTDAESNNQITYDRKGDSCNVIYVPLIRGEIPD